MTFPRKRRTAIFVDGLHVRCACLAWHSGGDANHSSRNRVTTHGQPERTQSFGDPFGREPELGVAACTQPPRCAFTLVQKVVHGHGGVRVFQKASEYSLLIAAS